MNQTVKLANSTLNTYGGINLMQFNERVGRSTTSAPDINTTFILHYIYYVHILSRHFLFSDVGFAAGEETIVQRGEDEAGTSQEYDGVTFLSFKV